MKETLELPEQRVKPDPRVTQAIPEIWDAAVTPEHWVQPATTAPLESLALRAPQEQLGMLVLPELQEMKELLPQTVGRERTVARG
jgi:hypothetical protein